MISSAQVRSMFSPASRSGSRMFSSAVSIGSRLKNWKMNPMWSRRSSVRRLSERFVMSVPAISTMPAVGLSRPARMCISVDLPEPDGPITAANWPGGDVEGDAAQGIDGGVALAVAAGDVTGGDDGGGGRRSCGPQASRVQRGRMTP